MTSLGEALGELGSGGLRVEMGVAFRELAVMLSSGTTVVRALDVITRNVRHPRLAKTFSAAAAALQQGAMLSKGLAANAEVFPPGVLELIRVGEDSGNLPGTLDRIATMLERQVALYLRVRSALTYPAFLGLLCLAIVVILPAFLFEPMFKMLAQLNSEIPWATSVVMRFSAVMRHPATYVVAAAVLTMVVHAWPHLMRDRQRKLALDRWLLSIRVIGPLLRYLAVARFAQALETLYSSGVQIFRAMESAGAASGNLAVEEAVRLVAERVRHGVPLHRALGEDELFPRVFVQLLAAGEETGEIPTMLKHFSQLAEGEIENRLQIFTAALEPAVMLTMGVVVGGITYATMSPMLRLMERLAL